MLIHILPVLLFSSQSAAESLLRSALQGKGYGKGPPLQLNGMAMMESPTHLGGGKGDDELRRVMFVTDQVTMLTALTSE